MFQVVMHNPYAKIGGLKNQDKTQWQGKGGPCVGDRSRSFGGNAGSFGESLIAALHTWHGCKKDCSIYVLFSLSFLNTFVYAICSFKNLSTVPDIYMQELNTYMHARAHTHTRT